MRSVTYYRYWVTAPGRKREYLTSFPMTAEDAASYPSARPEPSSREVREVPETPEEQAQAHYNYQSAGQEAVRPPARQNAGVMPAPDEEM